MEDEQHSLELIESTHDFPSTYMFKVIGRAEDDFVGRVLETVCIELNHDSPPPHRVRETNNGLHVAVTLEPMLVDAAQVLAVYRSLKTIEGIVMLW